MNKKIAILSLLFVCMLLLTGCCTHDWTDATCTEAKTCAKCGEIQGEPLGHTWVEASCTEPKRCETCQLQEGEARAHAWADATTEAPKTCTACGLTEGERIVTDPRFTTAANEKIFGTWELSVVLTGEYFDVSDIETVVPATRRYVFNNDGTYHCSTEVDKEAFNRLMTETTIKSTYEKYEAMGVSKEAADKTVSDMFNMDLESYVRKTMESTNLSDSMLVMFGTDKTNAVYYIDGDLLYLGDSWDSIMTPQSYILENDTLTLSSREGIFASLSDSNTFTMKHVTDETPAA